MSAILGRMATYSGQLITFDEALTRGRSLMPDTFSWEAMPKVVPDGEGRYAVPVPGQTQVLESEKLKIPGQEVSPEGDRN
jgi:hypothetical protein